VDLENARSPSIIAKERSRLLWILSARTRTRSGASTDRGILDAAIAVGASRLRRSCETRPANASSSRLSPEQELPRPREVLDETSLELAFSRESTLQFVQRAALPLERPSAEPVPLEPRETLTGTSVALDFPRGPRALPFENEALVAKPEALADTALDLDFSLGSALPVPKGKLARPAVPVRLRKMPLTQPLPAMASSEDLSGTSLELEFPRDPLVPFAKPAVAAPPPPPPGSTVALLAPIRAAAAATQVELKALLAIE